jgi:hypothetical protein
MIRIGANGNKITYGIKHYILDTEADLNLLPSNRESMGTTCFIIENSKYYMVNGKLEWIEIKPYCGSIGGGTEEDMDIIYDGGHI